MSNELLATLQRGGPLYDLFQKASGQVRAALEPLLESGSLAHDVEAVYGAAQQHVESGVADSPLAILRQCSAGCSACCHTLSVDVTPLEAIVMAEYLREHLDAAPLAAVKKRLEENAARRASMTAAQRAQVRLRCGLLGADGLCQVYEVRPLVCAGVYSLSRSACEQAAVAAGPNAPVPLDRPAKAWTMGISGGLQRALVEAGLDGNLYELNSIVLRALETDNVAERWLGGEDVFADCICTDPHSPPRLPAKPTRIDAAHAKPETPALLCRDGAGRSAAPQKSLRK